jgi:hypothetical protein
MTASERLPYTEHDTLPENWTRAVWRDGKVENRDDPAKWSADFAPPEVGAKVKATINRLGLATVIGYFTEEGWLGLRVRFADPPEWYTTQNKGNVPGCLFGAEVTLEGVADATGATGSEG